MKTRNTVTKLLSALAVAAVVSLCAASSAQASTHFGIISTESTSPRTAAWLNVTGMTGGAVTFKVYPADGGATVEDAVAMGPEFFATSESSTNPGIQNLFVGAGGQSALVRVDYPSGPSAVVLEQHSPEEKVVLGLPSLATAQSPNFWVPIGDLHRGTSLLIGNPNSSPNGIIIRYGQGAEQLPIAISAFGVVVIPVTVANTQLSMRATDPSLPFIAQLAVDTGKTTVMTYLTPPM